MVAVEETVSGFERHPIDHPPLAVGSPRVCGEERANSVLDLEFARFPYRRVSHFGDRLLHFGENHHACDRYATREFGG
jgi:hypothetical protein